jgi:hypothetical protein
VPFIVTWQPCGPLAVLIEVAPKSMGLTRGFGFLLSLDFRISSEWSPAMHRSKKWVNWTVSVLAIGTLAACGVEVQDEAPVAPWEIEQSVAASPVCTSSGTSWAYIDSKTQWEDACGGCSVMGLPARQGQYLERCCHLDLVAGTTTCKAWKFIRNTCNACSLE